MSSKITFIFDGECPFCNHFAELIELRSKLPNLEIKNARENPSELPDGYDMDTKGAVLLTNNQIFYGPKAINFICTKIKDPSDILLRLLTLIFSSDRRSDFIFPLLLISRRVALFFKGVPSKITFKH